MLGNLFSSHKDPKEELVSPQEQNPADTSTAANTLTHIESRMDPTLRQNVSALSHLDSRTTQVLHHAQEETRRIKQAQIQPEQVLLGLLYDEEVFKLLEGFDVDVAKLAQEIQSKEEVGSFQEQPMLSSASTQLFEQAYRDAKTRNASFVSPEDLLVEICNLSIDSVKLLVEKGVTKQHILDKLSSSTEYTTGKKSVLEQFAIDLTAEAKAGKLDPIAGRDREIDRLVHILLRRTKNNPIIIGEAGVGKTAIVEGLAQEIVAGSIPSDLKNKKIYQLDLASLVAGASHRGEFEERLKGIINETIASQGQIILFIDEIHTLIGAGDTDGALDASNIIKPHLARGHMQIIGTTTTVEYRKHFEKDKAFERRFQPILADEPSEEAAVEMLKVLRPKYEKYHGVTIPDDTLVDAVKLSKKYIGERYLPDKAVDLIDEASADVKLGRISFKQDVKESGENSNDTPPRSQATTGNEVVKSDIERVVSNWTGIPVTKLTEDESQKLLKLEDNIHKRLIDQQEAVVAVSEAVRRGRIGLAPANRPIASFIFLGPTGVGKTELAKTLAELLFGRDDALVRLDMSEYMEKHEVAKLIGAPPGYVGYEEGGQLTEAVRAKPYSIVLLDEVEKAHPDVFNILLQLLEDGRLTDNKGNTISFKNTIVIATSNIGSSLIQQQLSEKGEPQSQEAFTKEFSDLTTLVTAELRKFFKPELLNRFDDVVMFKPLRKADMTQIAKLGIGKTAKLLEEQGYHVQTTDAAIAQLAQEGYDPVYGARPLRRLIQSSIENRVALMIIGKEFMPGDTIVIDYNSTKGGFNFSKGGGQSVVGPEKNIDNRDNNTQPLDMVEKSHLPESGTGEAQALPKEPEYAQPSFNPPFLSNQNNNVNGETFVKNEITSASSN
ncbi:MAG: ATP-dependent Clp protease ATP-binding subunit [Candidatus Levybacteria bacterium]|nr:ATP-dependent Clp protease ATP-binding subunit [Candidatus Levybacteria bacterium]